LIYRFDVENQFEGVRIFIPAAVILTTDVFDENELREFALNANNDDEILKKFLKAKKFSKKAIADLTVFLELVQEPLAVRPAF